MMKIISFGDVHMATGNLRRMDEEVGDCDMVIVSGDLTNFGGVPEASKVLEDIRKACPNVLALAGNLDRAEVFPWLEEQGVALHGKGIEISGIGIFGCGGSNITPLCTPSEFTEEEIYETLKRGYEAVRQRRPLLMVCHTPPYNTRCDRLVGGKSVGSAAARRFIEEVQPDICISGHIHESAGTDKIGKTTVLNPGPFKGGGFIIVRLKGGELDARLEFL